jgi:hypothetical protein
MTSVPTPKASAAVSVCEHEKLLGKVAASVLEIDEAGQHRTRWDRHGKQRHSIKDISPGNLVHASSRWDHPATLGHMGDPPVNIEGLVQLEAHTWERVS